MTASWTDTYRGPYSNFIPEGQEINLETSDKELRRKFEANAYAFMEAWLINEGIVNYFDWCDRLEEAFPGQGKEAERRFEEVVLAGQAYRNGKMMMGDCFDGQYDDILSSWAVWCLEQNDNLKKALWI